MSRHLLYGNASKISSVWVGVLFGDIACVLNFHSCVWIFITYENIGQSRNPR